jgi:cell division protein ZapB
MNQDIDQELKNLEDKVEKLMGLCERLKIENRVLSAKQDDLIRDRARLLEKTALARSRVEAMITRLKSMGQSS